MSALSAAPNTSSAGMNAAADPNQAAMFQALAAPGPAQDRARRMMLYGRFVGSWNGSMVVWGAHRERTEMSSEVHFAWVLQGRAVQDVWIAPARVDGAPVMYGTTMRVYDPQADHWNITWIDPLKQTAMRMVGREVGEDIVQECRSEQGVLRQWMFTEIRPDSFHWIWRDATEDGGWTVRVEFFLRRR